MAAYIIKPAPSHHPMDSDKHGIPKPWREWFDEVAVELGYATRKKINTKSYTGSRTLVASDMGNIIKVTCNAPSTITLPTITSGLVDSWVTVLRLGTATIRIQAPATAAIESSGVGGGLVCTEAARQGANLTVFAASTTLYVILSGTGIWTVMGKSYV
jgi:hypothetical protein